MPTAIDENPYATLIDATDDASLRRTLLIAEEKAYQDARDRDAAADRLRVQAPGMFATPGLEEEAIAFLRQADALAQDAEKRRGLAQSFGDQAAGIRI